MDIGTIKQTTFEVDRALLDKASKLESEKEKDFEEVISKLSEGSKENNPTPSISKSSKTENIGDLSIYYNNLSVMSGAKDIEFDINISEPSTINQAGMFSNTEDDTVKYSEMSDAKIPKYTGGPTKYDSIIKEMADKYGMNFDLIKHVMKTESNFNHSVVSHAGATGLMQLMPATAKYVGVKDMFDVRQNIEGGVKYLRKMYDQHNKDIVLTLAAYNAGPGNVKKYGGVPPFKETQNYIKKILNIDVTR